jgi:hypothetical protein
MTSEHTFHIPVLGIGHSVDTPIRVAPFGISSVISLVDDLLFEPIRKYYCEAFDLDFEPIPAGESDGRTRRVKAYLDAVRAVVERKFDAIQKLPFFEENDKKKYFRLLPDTSRLKAEYLRMLGMRPGPDREKLSRELTGQMSPGSIDVNIMVKVDRMPSDDAGMPLEGALSDAKAALKGFAESRLCSAIVFSAGINQSLFTYMSQFKNFYRDASGRLQKKIILKVSDFRSALTQGRFLAKKGLEVHEFRIESGLNCGGHAFAGSGQTLPLLLDEFRKRRQELSATLSQMVESFYRKQKMVFPDAGRHHRALITVQGGIGNAGEDQRLREHFGLDRTGWGSPFLLVPEATAVDEETRALLERAGYSELYLSDVSPLGVPFNNVKNSGSERWTTQRLRSGHPGSGCPKGFLVSNTEFSAKPICVASRAFQKRKLAKIHGQGLPEPEKEALCRAVTVKTCLCEHLGNGALIALGIAKDNPGPQSVCPGPNLAWFRRSFTLTEMVDHIYGRGPSLVSPDRPHMFAREIELNVDYFQRLVEAWDGDAKQLDGLEEFRQNLEKGMVLALAMAEGRAYPGENLASIPVHIQRLRRRLADLSARLYMDDEPCAEMSDMNMAVSAGR